MGFFNKKKKDKDTKNTTSEIKDENKTSDENKKDDQESEFLKAMNEKKQEEDDKEKALEEERKAFEEEKKAFEAKKKELEEDKKEEKEEKTKKESKKEKKDYTKYNPILDKKFWCKLIGGVVLLVFALALLFQKDLRERICIGIFGGIVAVFAVYRVYPTFKYEKGALAKVLCIIEIIVDFAVGVLLVFGGFNFSDSGADLTAFTIKYFHYFLGLVFYLRGIVYTLSCILLGQKSNLKNYIINILCLSFGAYVFANDNFLVSTLGWVLVILALGSSLYLLVEGGVDYNNYRNHNEQRKRKVEEKKKAKEQKKKEKVAEKGEASKDKKSEKEEKIIIPNEKGNDQKQDIYQ